MSKTTTTTEEFDTEGNLLKRTVEVWEDEPTLEDVLPINDLESPINAHAMKMAKAGQQVGTLRFVPRHILRGHGVRQAPQGRGVPGPQNSGGSVVD